MVGEDLYALPLEEFTKARDALARELRSAGDREGAARVKALRKPNLAAWALNQLSRRENLEALFDANDRLRRAQRKLMSGGRPDDLRAASEERRRLVAELTARAERMLLEAGHAAAPQTLRAVSDSLLATATDEDGAGRLRAGVLERELEPGAVPELGGFTVLPGGQAPAPSPPPAEDTAALREMLELARGHLAELEDRTGRAEREAAELEAAAAAAREQVDAAGRSLEEAEDALEEARRRVQALHEEVEMRRRRAAAAEGAARSARDEASALRAQTDEAARVAEQAARVLGEQ